MGGKVIFAILAGAILVSGQIAFADPNLVSWWEFDEGSGTTAYDSAGNNDGTLVGDPCWVSGRVGSYALDFDGDNDYVEVNDQPLFNNMQAITISSWIKADEFSNSYPRIVNKAKSTSNNDKSFDLAIEQSTSKVYFSAAGQYIKSSDTLATGVWYHIAATFDGDLDEQKIYINGVLDTSVSNPGNFVNTTGYNIYVGSFDPSILPSRWWNGSIDDVRVYNRALSTGEVEQLFQYGEIYIAFNPNPADGATGVDPNVVLSWQPGEDVASHDVYFGTDYNDVNGADVGSPEYEGNFDVNYWDPCGLELLTTYYWRIDEVNDSNLWKGNVWSFRIRGSDPNLVSWWEFDEGSGATAYDSAGSNNGSIMGATWTTGQINGALSFDGVNDYVDVGNDGSLKPPLPLTLSAWIRLSGLGSSKRIVVLDNQTSKYYGVWFYVAASNTLGVGYGDGGSPASSNRRTKSGTTALSADTWYHVGVVIKGPTDMNLYIDSVDDGGAYSGTGGSLKYSSSGSSLIGNNHSSAAPFDGKIDDVRVYNRALLVSEIEQLFREGHCRAFDPNPADEATDVHPNTVLSWSPGYQAASHDVYLGTDYNDVNDANTSSSVYVGNFDVNSYDPCGLDILTTYYWRIDEVNDPNLWKGDVWSFETTGSVIGLSATQLDFYAIEGGVNPDDQILSIRNSGGGTLNWETNEDCGWLSVEPSSGSSTGEADDVNLSADISGLGAGMYDCELTISDPNAVNNPQTAGVTLHVGDYDSTLYVPSEYSTIQEAIDVALDGDVVIVEPNVYTGSGNRDLDFGGKAITVRSTDPNDPDVVAATVIDCESVSGHRGFYFHSSEGANSIVSGFTIKRGKIVNKGGGIFCEGSSPTIKNCIITDNSANGNNYSSSSIRYSYGGGIFCTSSSHPTIINCTISNNTASGGAGWHEGDGGHSYGGGIYGSSDSNLTIINCIIASNTAKGGKGGDEYEYPGDGGNAYGGGICIYGALTIENSIIADNRVIGGSPGDTEIGYPVYGQPYGGGIYCGPDNNPTIRNCTISGNELLSYQSVDYCGAGICSSGGTTTILSSIIWGNYGYEIYGSGFNISYSDVEGGYSGTGNIDSDPCFTEPANGNYHLDPCSICINAGDPNYSQYPGETDIDGEQRVMSLRVDMGADEVNVEAGVPIIELSSTAFVFYAYEGGINPEDQILSICNGGTGTLVWEITEDCNWLSVEPNSDSSTGEFDDVNLMVDISGLSAAIYNCNLTVSDANASNSPQTVAVQLHISKSILRVPSEHGTIQEAIDVALDGSVVIVEPNVYTGSGNRDLDFGGKAITVRSTDPNNSYVVAITVIDCQSATGHRGFYFHSGEGPNSVVSGFTIKRGKVNNKGGGIYCQDSSPTIEKCIITNNLAYGLSGGEPGEDGDPAYGGGIYCTSSSHPTIIDCTISNNTARGGTGAGGTSFDPAGDGGLSYGGGIYCSSVTINNTIINNNAARGGKGGNLGGAGPAGGGGIARGGGIYGAVIISDCIVSNNIARGGPAGEGCSEPPCSMPAYADGGGIHGNATVDNCLIINNIADNADEEYWEHYGGGIYSNSATITNCTIYNNTACEAGGGIYCNSGGTIIDSILWGNDDDLYGCSATYSCIEDGDTGTGNISSDPLFVTGPGGDYYLSQIAAGQASNSPCIDAGSDTAANLGMDAFTTRTDGVGDISIVDMGYHHSLPNPADIDRDWDVDMADYAILASQWQQTSGTLSADISPPGGDGIVDINDLSLLVDYWLWGK